MKLMRLTTRYFAPSVLVLGLPVISLGQQTEVAAPPQANGAAAPVDAAADVEGEYEVMTRGQLHEAFATPTTHDPIEQPLVEKAPLKPLQEALPSHKPQGDNIIWIPGYWAYDDQVNDFLWISGLWRDVPPGRQWIPGYWNKVDNGYRWIPGSWARANDDIRFYPKPPKSQERGPSSPQPSANHFYVPGCWVYQENDYRWRAGYWAPYQSDWIWIPARYTAAANGYIYTDGYWDYRIDRRGQLFAPVRFRNDIYTSSRYTPQAVISNDVALLMHLFVRPNRGDYVYGNYYETSATPWFVYHQQPNGYDPLLVHYRWYNGEDYVNRIRGWHNYFASNPDYRPRPTLTEQRRFAKANQDFQYLNQATLATSLAALVSTGNNRNQFVELGAQDRERLTGITNQVRSLVGERLKLETTVAANAETEAAVRLPSQTLRLPQLPGVRAPRVGADVPDIPRNLRQVVRPNARTPRINVPNVPNIDGRVPNVRTPRVPGARVPNVAPKLRVPAPRVPAPRVPAPRVPAPKIPTPSLPLPF